MSMTLLITYICTYIVIASLRISHFLSFSFSSVACRQQKLEQLAEKFSRKAGLRESWLRDMSQVLDEINKGQDVHGVDAALKRHEAISADVQAGESRIQVKGHYI